MEGWEEVLGVIDEKYRGCSPINVSFVSTYRTYFEGEMTVLDNLWSVYAVHNGSLCWARPSYPQGEAGTAWWRRTLMPEPRWGVGRASLLGG